MTELKLAIIDDESGWIATAKKHIEKAAKSANLRIKYVDIVEKPSSPKKDLLGLLDTLVKARSKAKTSKPEFASTPLDDAELVLIDYDLSTLERDDGLFTGELVSQLVRQYTSAGPVVSINRRPVRVFDLGYRRPNTHADFSLNSDDLEVGSLWGGQRTAFDPWPWPNLVQHAHTYKERVKFVQENFAKTTLEALSIPPEAAVFVQGEDVGIYVDLARGKLEELAAALVPPKERVPDEVLPRLAASMIWSWLSAAVLPRQDAFIDAPHVIRQFPSLFTGRWEPSELAKLAVKYPSAKLPLDDSLMSAHAYPLPLWFDRPVWWTNGLLRDNRIKDVSKPWERRQHALEFAEDTSRFVRQADLNTYTSEGFFPTRYVELPRLHREDKFRDIRLEPSWRLAA